MKKISLLLFLLSLISISVFAADPNKKFSFNEQDPAQLDAWTTTKFKVHVPLLKALIGKDSSNISYEEFKEIITKNLDASKKTSAKGRIVMAGYHIPRFKGFAKNIINDTTLPDTNKWRVVYTHHDEFTADEFRTYFKKYILIFDKCEPVLINKSLDRYSKKTISCKTDDIKEDLQLLKRVIYKRMEESEEMKKILVKLELMIKSL